MGGIVILGVFVADTSFRATRPPRMGETILGTSFALGPGGKGSNQSVAAARLGGDVTFLSKLGVDAFAEMARGIWAEAGVKPAITDAPESYTGAAYIFIEDGTGDNAIIIAPGAGGTISASDMDAEADLVGGADIFMTQLEQPMEAALRALEIAKAGGARTILNPAPAADLPGGMLGLCDYVTPNETEAEELTGIAVATEADAAKAADAFLDKGVTGVIITLGERGAFYKDATTAFLTPAITAGPLVETTGAGDAFNAGFAVGLLEGRGPQEAVRLGIATAGLSVTKPGTAASMPSRAEVDTLLKTA